MVNIGDVNHFISWKCLNYVLTKYSRLRAGASKRFEKCVAFRQFANYPDVCQMTADDHEKKLR